MKELYKKLATLKKEVGAISKDETNPFFKSKYFDINGLIEHLEPLLQKNGLILLQPLQNNKVITQIIDAESGDMVQSILDFELKSDPQKVGSEITYYRRYTLQSLLGLRAEDDDANKASGNGSTKDEPKKPWLNKGTQEWDNVLNAIRDGKVSSIDIVRKKFAVNKDLATELETLISERK